jgi:hypothetical protein
MAIKTNQKKKLDLLKFQKNLNDQFLEIFSHKNEKGDDLVNQDTLGLSFSYNEINFFIPLYHLQSIATKINYENSIRTKSWVLGFNQDHGNIYTIFNMNKVFSKVLEGNTDFETPSISINSNIVYLRNYHEESHGLLLENFKLEYTAEYTLLLKHQKNDDMFYWDIAEGIDFGAFVKKQNMSNLEWELINNIYQASKNSEQFKSGVYPQHDEKNKYTLLSLMIESVYLDGLGQRPIFTLNVENLTKFLINVSPF